MTQRTAIGAALLMLLGAASVGLHIVCDDGPQRIGLTADERLAAKLAQRVDVDVAGEPLEDVLARLASRHDVMIQFDEPKLKATPLQHVYGQRELRDEILDLVAQDVNEHSRNDRGREGLDYWQIVVLAAVRLGCDLDYDKLQDLAEQHRALRQIMGIGDWQEKTDWRNLQYNRHGS